MCLRTFNETICFQRLRGPLSVPLEEACDDDLGDGRAVNDDSGAIQLSRVLSNAFAYVRDRCVGLDLGHDCDQQDLVDKSRTLARSLQHWVKVFEPGWLSSGASNKKYNAMQVLQAAYIALASSQKAENFRDLVQSVLEYMWPGSCTNMTAARSHSIEKSTSNQFLNTAIFLTDVAHMLLQQDTLANTCGGYVFYWRCDSSPQGGYDWLVSSYIMIANLRVRDAFVALTTLARLGAGLARAESSKWTRILCKLIDLHVQIPIALARGSTNLAQKVAALLHALFMECANFTTLRRVLANSASFTTDMGTEFGTADFRVADYFHLLPVWIRSDDAPLLSGEQLDFDGGANGNEPDGLEPDVGASVQGAVPSERFADFLFSNCFRVAGMLHTITNSLQDSFARFSYWPQFELMLVSRLISNQSLRDSFVAECCIGTPFAFLQTLLPQIAPKFIKWRWGSLSKVLETILKVGLWVRRAWISNGVKFRTAVKTSRQERGGDDEGDLDFGLLDKALKSSRFFVYCEALALHHELPDQWFDWFEKCPCHRWLYDANDDRVTKERKFRMLLFDKTRAVAVDDVDAFKTLTCCPCGGMNLPEAVRGDHLVSFKRMSESNLAELVHRAQRWDPQQGDVDIALQDLEAGGSLMLETLELKLAHLQNLPYCAAGMALAEEDQGRQWAAKSMAKFDLDPRPHLHHRISLEFFEHGSDTRIAIEEWVKDGEPLQSFPDLARAVAKIRFIPMTEREIEAEHGRLKKKIAFKKARHTLCSSLLRTPLLRRRLKKYKRSIPDLLKNIEIARSCDSLAKRLGLGKYMKDQLATIGNGAKVRSHIRRRELRSAIYRSDLTTQTKKRKEATKYHEKVDAKQKKQQRVKSRSTQPSYDNILAREWLAHFRHLVVGSNVVIEVPSGMDLSLESSRDFMSTPAIAIQPRTNAEELESEGQGLGSNSTGSYLVKVVHARPSGLKLVQPHAASGRLLDDSDVCVTLHSSLGDGKYVSARPKSHSDGRRVLSGTRGKLDLIEHIHSYV